jgi:phospholipid-translocating ATPase
MAPQPLRTFHVNDSDTNTKLFVGNQIVTSKYTVINFLPKNLVDQFSKLANIYFLAMMILQVRTLHQIS